ncbi:hypothetical protein ATO10_14259 [Actibacterium atlanticum]|uniref:YjiS-like domain-containing protein n=1 Tax=Actibacterium atlanticum TaxID=1461693 RepID=A0A058ZIE9_9RHOB|nr:DUF1127 domain-containing protein [Actibacterium atlanticum]KCV80972.1 hypothetical protein ATO10_14259 [Actibacterium atlanticum]
MTHFTQYLGTARAHGRQGSFFTSLRAAFMLGKQRHELAQLSDAQLDDLGLTRDQVLAEAKRPVWDVPSNWRG